jgi:DNA-binding transcriptional LysR family regulator
MYTLSHIRTFVKVVELNNFSAAARKLSLTVAAVSKHVSQLEAELKITLMKRTTRKLILTDIGHQYYLQCKKILSAIEQADAIISQTQNEPVGKLRVKSERYFAERFIVPKLHLYHELYPKVQIDLESSERVPDLITERFDVVFGRSLQQTENIIKKHISTTHFTLCASPEYLQEHGHPKQPRELINHQYLSHKGRLPTDTIEFGKNEQIYLEPTILINDSDALLQCALSHMGIIKLQHYVVSQALAEGRLIELLDNYPDKSIPIHVFYQPEKYIQTKIKTFIEFICKDLPEEM